MGNARNLWLVILVSGGACVEPESGVGYSSTGGTGDGPVSGSAYVEPEEPAERSYFIAESMDYTDNGCTNADDLIDVTSSLRAALVDDGWSGTRMTEAMTVPADFVDSFNLAYGRDDMAADSARLSVYAGHGYMNSISWGTRDTNPELSKKQGCRARFSDGVRLGRMAGGWARIVLLMTSCTGNLECYESSLAASDATQILAFNNSPYIWHRAAKRFYRKSKRMANRYAWIRAMDNGSVTKNSPITYTRGTSLEDALATHSSARLAEIENIPSTTDTTWYAYTWVDHGLHGSCARVPNEC